MSFGHHSEGLCDVHGFVGAATSKRVELLAEMRLEHVHTAPRLLLQLVHSRRQMRIGTSQPTLELSLHGAEKDFANLVEARHTRLVHSCVSHSALPSCRGLEELGR